MIPSNNLPDSYESSLSKCTFLKQLGREFHKRDTDTVKDRLPSASRQKRGQTKLVEPY